MPAQKRTRPLGVGALGALGALALAAGAAGGSLPPTPVVVPARSGARPCPAEAEKIGALRSSLEPQA